MKNKDIVKGYRKYTCRKAYWSLFLVFLLFVIAIYSLSVGSMHLPAGKIINTFLRPVEKINEVVIWNIRFPRIFAAVIAGMGLAVAGCVMQSVLKNPLASPFTMGISQGAAFGAAFAIIVLGLGMQGINSSSIFNSPYVVTIFAFLGSLIGIVIILLLARFTGLSPEAMILAGIAMGTLFSSGTMFLQYFADDVEVASVVFWTFGDIGRVGKKDIAVMSLVTIPALLYFISKRWDYNVLASGDETAKALGVNTEQLRFVGILVSALITSVAVAFLGIIGFIGLVSPHIVRRVIGGDHRFLIPASAIFGGILLLLADTLSRTIMSPIVLPVGILTSFMGVPLFIYLILKRSKQY